MTETDATKRPLAIPEEYVPYLEKYRLYKLFKDMVRDLVLALPKDHLKFMKMYLNRRVVTSNDVQRILILASPEVKKVIDLQKLVKKLMRALDVFVFPRRYLLDRYKKHDDYEPGCISPALFALTTKLVTEKDPVPQIGWLMFDHPCTMREARSLQQDGVLPTVTLVLDFPPPQAPPTYDPHTPVRTFFDQDFEGLKFVYKATLKDVYVELQDDTEKIVEKCINAIRACPAGAQGPGQGHHVLGAPAVYRVIVDVYVELQDDTEKIVEKCINAIRACAAGAQGPGQGHHVLGAPAVYRVIVVGARGSGRTTQARLLAKHFGLMYIHFDELFASYRSRQDALGEKLRLLGETAQLKSQIVSQKLCEKDCLEMGWVLIGYPKNGEDFELLDRMKTPPNRIIFLNADRETCTSRIRSRRQDWCTGEAVTEDHPRASTHPQDQDTLIDSELEHFFSEALVELRAAAGVTMIEINALEPIDQVQTKILAAVMAAPSHDFERGAKPCTVHKEHHACHIRCDS